MPVARCTVWRFLESPYFRRHLELRPEAGDFGKIKGWLIKTRKQIDTRKELKRWGGGFFSEILAASFLVLVNK